MNIKNKNIIENEKNIFFNILNYSENDSKFYNIKIYKENSELIEKELSEKIEQIDVFFLNEDYQKIYLKYFDNNLKLSNLYIDFKLYEESYEISKKTFLNLEKIKHLKNYEVIFYKMEFTKLLKNLINEEDSYFTLIKQNIYEISGYIDSNKNTLIFEERDYLESNLINFIYEMETYFYNINNVKEFNIFYDSYINMKKYCIDKSLFEYTNWKHVKIEIEKIILNDYSNEKKLNLLISIFKNIEEEFEDFNFNLNIIKIQILFLIINFNDHEENNFIFFSKIYNIISKYKNNKFYINNKEINILELQYLSVYIKWIYNKSKDIDFVSEEIKDFKNLYHKLINNKNVKLADYEYKIFKNHLVYIENIK